MSERMLLFTLLALAVLTTGVCLWFLVHVVRALAMLLVFVFLVASGGV